MFRLAHISDPHLGPLPQPSIRQLASKRVFGYVNWRRNRKKTLASNILERLIEDLHTRDINHLAVTGDLVNLALPAEIANARLWLDGLGDPNDVSVVLGNHDAYVPRSRSKAEEAWAPFLRSDDSHQSDNPFPYLRIRDNVALIGVNSARATMPMMATGYFLAKQARQLSDILRATEQRGLFRVIMIHHPPCHRAAPRYKRLIGANRFRKVIAELGAELILHGHTHLPTQMQLNSPDGSVPVIGVASASQGPGGHKPAARYNLFDISGEKGNWRCEMTEYGYSDKPNSIDKLATRMLWPSPQSPGS